MTPTPIPTHAADGRAPGRWWVLLGCLALALAVYLPTALRAGFLNFDDNLFFGPDNPLFAAATERSRQHGVLAGLATVLDPRHVVADVYLPVAHGSLWLDLWWFGGAPFGPHLVSLLLHALAAFVLARFLAAMRLPAGVALPAAALFLLHPALCESVAWVSGRKDVLCGLFVFAALHQTVRQAGRPSALRLCGLGALGVLAMYSKAAAVVQPLLSLLVCLCTGGDRRRFLAPTVLLLVTLPIAWHHRVLAAAAGTMVGGSVLDRLPQAPGALLHYLHAALWPTGLDVLYPEVKTLAAFRDRLVPGTAALCAVLALTWWSRRRRDLRPLAFGLGGFLLALLPYNTAWPASVIAAADRYLYLAVPFLAVAVLQVAAVLARRPAVAGAALAIPLLLLCWQRAPVFADSERLWEASLGSDPDNAVALLNLLQARQSRGTLDLAAHADLAARAAAAARYPEHELRADLELAQVALADGHVQQAAAAATAAIGAAERVQQGGRATAEAARRVLVQALLAAITPLRLAGRADDARAVLARAEALLPAAPEVVAAAAVVAIDDLAAELRRTGAAAPADDDPRIVGLRSRLDAASARMPRAPQLLLAEGTLERLLGRRLQAIACFRRALQAEPGLAEAWLAAAEVCLQAGLYGDGEDYARSGIAALHGRGLEVDPRLRHALARALAGQGRLDDAILQLEPYVQMRPKDRDAARLLSSLLMGKAVQRMSDPRVTHAELQRLIDRALAVNPQEPRVDLVRARLCRDQRNFRAAVEALDRAIAALPDFADARTQLAENLRDLGYECWERKDDDGAAAAWKRFLAAATPDVPTEAVKMQLQGLWRRAESEGIEATTRGDRARAEQAFRRCLRIDPDQHWASYLLATVLIDRRDADLAELDRLSADALAWQVQHGLDRSRQVVLRALVLRRLARPEEARALVAGYLAAPDADAPGAVLAVLRQMNA